jgi:predicted thioesterase
MKKKIFALALVFALSVSSAVVSFAAPSASGSTNESSDRSGSSETYTPQNQAANGEGTKTTVTADGSTMTTKSENVTVEGVAATFDDGTVKGNGVDIQIQSATATVNGVTFTSLINKGNIDGKSVDIKVQLATVGGQTAGVLVDPATGVPSTYTGTLTIVLADGRKVIVNVVKGVFVVA